MVNCVSFHSSNDDVLSISTPPLCIRSSSTRVTIFLVSLSADGAPDVNTKAVLSYFSFDSKALTYVIYGFKPLQVLSDSIALTYVTKDSRIERRIQSPEYSVSITSFPIIWACLLPSERRGGLRSCNCLIAIKDGHLSNTLCSAHP